jgi:hypothetical protein
MILFKPKAQSRKPKTEISKLKTGKTNAKNKMYKKAKARLLAGSGLWTLGFQLFQLRP